MTRPSIAPGSCGAGKRPAAFEIPGLMSRLIARRMLQLIEPIEAHRLDDAVTDHDQPRLRIAVIVMLMNGERRDVDEVSALPLVPLRRRLPLVLELVETIESEVPVQVVAAPLEHEQDFLPHVPMPAGAAMGWQELHVR